MNIPELIYPNLYDAANDASSRAQKLYLRLMIAEYCCLVLSAILSYNISKSPFYFSLCGFILILSAGILIYRSTQKPEQDWYRSRALAESIKTATWRYMMRAEPFDGLDHSKARAEFVEYLKAILTSNRFLGRIFSNTTADTAQITKEMDFIRSLLITDRHKYYIENRIRQQRAWYSKKSKQNKIQFQIFFSICISAYAVAIFLSFLKVGHPEVEFSGVEPLIVIASSFIGWIQIKKYNELASAYSLTAHEIGMAEELIKYLRSEKRFVDDVNEVERAFSREHTQWVARQEET